MYFDQEDVLEKHLNVLSFYDELMWDPIVGDGFHGISEIK
jgi:hypothetical protein